MCESFFATLECELIERRSFRSHAEARMAIFDFIEGWYKLLFIGLFREVLITVLHDAERVISQIEGSRVL